MQLRFICVSVEIGQNWRRDENGKGRVGGWLACDEKTWVLLVHIMTSHSLFR